MASLTLGFQHHHPLPSLPPSLSTTRAKRRIPLIARAVSEDGTSPANSSEGSASASPPPPPPSPPPNKSSGSGFGSRRESKKRRRGKERGTVVRRSPIERPSALYGPEGRASKEQQSVNESAFLLTWLGLGLLILVEGVVLAASGFLPEEWDTFFVKYLYPSFTPTVFLFVGGTVAYGVFKYLQNEKMKS